MRKSIIINIILFTIICIAVVLYTASMPFITTRHDTDIYISSDGEGASYRELCGLAYARWEYLHWFKLENNFETRVGCILADQPLTKIKGRLYSKGSNCIILNCSVGITSPDQKLFTEKTNFTIKYDLKKKSVTLLNTKQSYPIALNNFYIVHIDDKFEIIRFDSLDKNYTMTDLHPKVNSLFTDLMSPKSKTIF